MALRLVSLTDLKTRLGITGTSEDTALTALGEQLETLIEKSIGYPILDAEYTRYLDGSGTPWLVLPFRMVTQVNTVSLADSGYWNVATPTWTTLTEGTDYALRADPSDFSGNGSSGMIYRINGTWPTPFRRQAGLLSPYIYSTLNGNGNVKVVFRAGYASTPLDIVLAICDVVGMARASSPYGTMLQSEGYEGYSYSLLGSAVQSAWLGYLSGGGGSILNRYRRLPI